MFSMWRRPKTEERPRSLYGNLIAFIKARLEQHPSDLRLRLSLVSHLRMAGRHEEAIQHIERVLHLNPADRRAKALLLRLRLEQRLAAIHRMRG